MNLRIAIQGVSYITKFIHGIQEVFALDNLNFYNMCQGSITK